MTENRANPFCDQTVKEQRTSKLDKLQAVRTVNTFSDENNNYHSNSAVCKTKSLSSTQNANDNNIVNQNTSKLSCITKVSPSSTSSTTTTTATTTKLKPTYTRQKAKIEKGQEEKQTKKDCLTTPSAHAIQAAQIKLLHWHVANLQRQSKHLTEEREALLDTMECVVNEHEKHMTKLKEEMKQGETTHVESVRALHIRRKACEQHKQEVLDEIDQMHSKIEQSQRTRDELRELLVLESEKLSEESVKLDKARAKCNDANTELQVQRQEEIKMSDDAYGLHGEAKEVMLHIKSLLKETEKVKVDAMAEELTRRVLFSRCEELKGTIRVYCRVKAPQHITITATVHETITNTMPQTSNTSTAINKEDDNDDECTELSLDNLRSTYKRERSTSSQTLISPQKIRSVKARRLSLRSTSMEPTLIHRSASRSCSTKKLDEHSIEKSITKGEEYVKLEETMTPSRSTHPTEDKLYESEKSCSQSLIEIKTPSPSPSPSPSPQPFDEEWKAASFSKPLEVWEKCSSCTLDGEDDDRCNNLTQEIVNCSSREEEEEEENTSCSEEHLQIQKQHSYSYSLPNNTLDNNNGNSSGYRDEYKATSINNSTVVATRTTTQKLFTFANPRFDVDAKLESNENSDNTSSSNNHLFRSITAHQSRANATSTGVVELSESFYYDCVFAPESTQSDIYLEVEPLVHNAIDGYRICVFAYGQTGSGKTYTMEGNLRCRAEYGVIPRAMETIFSRQIELANDGWSYELSCTIIEIHNEVIYDLTQNPSIYVGVASSSSSSSRRVNTENSTNYNVTNIDKNNKTKRTHNKCYHSIRHNSDGTFVSNVQEHHLHNMRDFIDVYQRAICNRHTAKTLLNTSSSRSHCIFTLHINGTNAILRQCSRGVLCLVDLAGSERVNESGATGNQFKEAVKINRSLLDLGKCITAMQTNAVVPWRNSQLTYLLQNYMNAKGAKTLMIVTVSDQAEHLPESVNSLRFAQRVQQTLLGKSVKQVSSYEPFADITKKATTIDEM